VPDKPRGVVPAVTSEKLVGTTADWKGQAMPIGEENLADLVERQLSPQGIPKGYDASVLNWSREGNLYLNEPDSEKDWPGFSSA